MAPGALATPRTPAESAHAEADLDTHDPCVHRWHQATELLALSRGRREQPVVPNQMPPRRGNDPA